MKESKRAVKPSRVDYISDKILDIVMFITMVLVASTCIMMAVYILLSIGTYIMDAL